MSQIFITSDLHFFHQNILTFCSETRKRYYNGETAEDSSAYEMSMKMAEEWNSTVTPNDTIYILGDVSFGNITKTDELLSMLNGTKILIAGNHDRKLLKKPDFTKHFSEIHWLLNRSFLDKYRVVMCHFPLLEWENMQKGALHFHGHTHGSRDMLHNFRILDVGMDATNKLLLPIESAINLIKDNEIRKHGTSNN